MVKDIKIIVILGIMVKGVKPKLFIICGHVGAGKTTTANMLGELLNVRVASVDETIISLFDEPSFLGKDIPPSPFERSVCYNAFALIADYMLSTGNSIIIDGVFAHKKQREYVVSKAKKYKTDFFIIEIICPEDVLEKRAKERYKKGKGVGFSAHKEIKKIYEPLDQEHYTIDTSKDVKKQLLEFLRKVNISY